MQTSYPVQFDVDFPDRPLNRLTTAFRIFWAIPILIVISTLSGGSTHTTGSHTTEYFAGGSAVLFVPPLLMILFPAEVSPLVVRLEPQFPSLLKPRHGVPDPAR